MLTHHTQETKLLCMFIPVKFILPGWANWGWSSRAPGSRPCLSVCPAVHSALQTPKSWICVKQAVLWVWKGADSRAWAVYPRVSWLYVGQGGSVRLGPNASRSSGSVGGIYLMPLGYENEPQRRGMEKKSLSATLGCL